MHRVVRPSLLPVLLGVAVLAAGCAPGERSAQVEIRPKAVASPTADETTYAWADGDELAAVAKRFSCSVEWLVERNSIVSRKDLVPGRELVVPRR